LERFEKIQRGEQMKQTQVIHLRIDTETMEAIREQARANYRTISQEINFTLKQNTQQGGVKK
jgi:hypothetical protein